MFSRRKFVATGAATGAVALLSPAIIRAAYGAGSTNKDVSSLITVTQSSDPTFVGRVNKLFPGLLLDPVFQKIQSHAVLITNVSGQPIAAHNTIWKAETPQGTLTATRLHLFHPNTRKPTVTSHFGRKGNTTRFTGAIPVLKTGATRLVTPYFNWSPRYYRTQKHKRDWETILAAKASRPLIRKKLLDASTIQVSVDTVIFNRKEMVGPTTGHLVKVFRKSRNGEHDEALAIKMLLESGLDRSSIKTILKQDAKLPIASTINPSTDPIYLASRARLAKVLLRRLKHSKPDQFVRTLNYLVSQPRTTVGLYLTTNLASQQSFSEGDAA